MSTSTNANTPLQREKARASITAYNKSGKHGRLRHGHAKGGQSIEYTTWANMIQRCRNPKNNHYSDYGGRGISVCAQWSDFAQFFRDMGKRPIGKSLDRIDNNGNYEPANCRWASRNEQRANQRPCLAKPNSRGEKNAMARLTEDQARQILARRGEVHEVIARDFGVCRETVSMLLRGATWKHLQMEAI